MYIYIEKFFPFCYWYYPAPPSLTKKKQSGNCVSRCQISGPKAFCRGGVVCIIDIMLFLASLFWYRKIIHKTPASHKMLGTLLECHGVTIKIKIFIFQINFNKVFFLEPKFPYSVIKINEEAKQIFLVSIYFWGKSNSKCNWEKLKSEMKLIISIENGFSIEYPSFMLLAIFISQMTCVE